MMACHVHAFDPVCALVSGMAFALHATLWQWLWDCVLSANRLVSCQQQSVTAPPGQKQAAVLAKDVFFIYYMVVLLPVAFKILTRQDCDFKISMK